MICKIDLQQIRLQKIVQTVERFQIIATGRYDRFHIDGEIRLISFNGDFGVGGAVIVAWSPHNLTVVGSSLASAKNCIYKCKKRLCKVKNYEELSDE